MASISLPNNQRIQESIYRLIGPFHIDCLFPSMNRSRHEDFYAGIEQWTQKVIDIRFAHLLAFVCFRKGVNRILSRCSAITLKLMNLWSSILNKYYSFVFSVHTSFEFILVCLNDTTTLMFPPSIFQWWNGIAN